MAKKLGFIVILSMCLLIVEFSSAQEESPSPAVSPEPEFLADSPPPPSSSPKADSLPSPASSPESESLADSPSPPPPPPQPESPSAPSPSPSSSSSPSPGPSPVPAPSDDDSDDEFEPETEYFHSPAPSPAPELGKPDDIKASEDGDEYEEERGEDSGMSGLTRAGIAIGAILGVGAIVIGALVYKKRRDNLTRARYTYFNQGEFL